MRPLCVMEIHDPFQIFLLRRRDIIVIGDYIHVQTLELFSNSVHDFPRLVHFVEDSASSSNLQSMAAAYHNPHYFVLSIRDFISTQFSTAGMDLPSAVIIRHLTLL